MYFVHNDGRGLNATMASPADTARALMFQKENIEAQLQVQAAILSSNAGSTLDSPLIDADGYPRADIDIYAVRNARIRIIELRNDLIAVMNALALALQSVYDPALAPVESPQPSTNGKPFAKVDGVSPGSPAAEAVSGPLLSFTLFSSQLRVCSARTWSSSSVL